MAKNKELPEDEGLEDVDAEVVDDSLDDDEELEDDQLDSEDDDSDEESDDSEEEEAEKAWYEDYEIDGFAPELLSQFKDVKHFNQELVKAHRARIAEFEQQNRAYQQQLQAQRQPSQPAAAPKDDTPKRSKLEELREQYRGSVPEWKPEYERLLKQDESGQIVAIPGADPTLPQKYLQYQEFLRNQTQRFITDPHGFLEENILPAIYEHVRNEFSQADQSSVDRLQNEQVAQSILNSNAGWMFDQNRQLTPAGQQYGQVVSWLETQKGFSPQEADAMAKATLFGPGGQPQIQQQAPAPTPEQKREESNRRTLANGAKRRKNKSGRVNKPGRDGEKPAQGNDFKEQLSNAFASSGFTDDDFI